MFTHFLIGSLPQTQWKHCCCYGPLLVLHIAHCMWKGSGSTNACNCYAAIIHICMQIHINIIYAHTPAVLCTWLSPTCTTGSITASSLCCTNRWRSGTASLFFLRHALARSCIKAIPHVLSTKQSRTRVEAKSAGWSQAPVQVELLLEATGHRIQSSHKRTKS